MRSAHPYVQALLVQAAWRVWSSDPRVAALRSWEQAIERRRGKDRDRRVGPTTRSHSLRDVARRNRLSAGEDSDASDAHSSGRNAACDCLGLDRRGRQAGGASAQMCWPR